MNRWTPPLNMILAHCTVFAFELRMLDHAINADDFTCMDRSQVQRLHHRLQTSMVNHFPHRQWRSHNCFCDFSVLLCCWPLSSHVLVILFSMLSSLPFLSCFCVFHSCFCPCLPSSTLPLFPSLPWPATFLDLSLPFSALLPSLPFSSLVCRSLPFPAHADTHTNRYAYLFTLVHLVMPGGPLMRRWAPAEFHHGEHAVSRASGYGPARSSRWQKKEPGVVEFAGADASQNVSDLRFCMFMIPFSIP